MRFAIALCAVLLLAACAGDRLTGDVTGAASYLEEQEVVGRPGKDCSIFPGLNIQLRCELEKGAFPGVRDRVCDNVADEGLCTRVHLAVPKCYDAADKRACYRDAVDGDARGYAVALLDELHHRILTAYREGEVTSITAVQLIISNQLYKRAVLNGEDRGELSARMQNYRSEYERLMP